MKALYILPYGWGGLCHYTVELANAVSEYASTTVIVTNDFDVGQFRDKVEVLPIIDPMSFSVGNPVKALSPSNLLRILPSAKLNHAVDRIAPDVIHLTTLLAPPLSSSILFYGLDRRYPMVLTKHGIYSDSGGLTRFLESLLLLSERPVRFRWVIVHDRKDRETLAARDERMASRISVVPHGIYSFFAGCGARAEPQKDCILFFGQIKDYKGLDYLLKAVPDVVREVPGLKVVIAGDGDLAPYKHLLSDKARFEVHNEFVSNEQAAELFQRAEIVVLPYSTMRSGQSGVLHVAFAFKKPVVATLVGGIPEAVQDGREGLLVPPRDAPALARSIIRLLRDDDLKKTMAKNIESRLADLSWDKAAQETMRIYQRVLDGDLKRG